MTNGSLYSVDFLNAFCLLQSSATDDEMVKRRPNDTTKSEVVNEAVSRKRVSGTSKKLKDALVHQVIQVRLGLRPSVLYIHLWYKDFF